VDGKKWGGLWLLTGLDLSSLSSYFLVNWSVIKRKFLFYSILEELNLRDQSLILQVVFVVLIALNFSLNLWNVQIKFLSKFSDFCSPILRHIEDRTFSNGSVVSLFLLRFFSFSSFLVFFELNGVSFGILLHLNFVDTLQFTKGVAAIFSKVQLCDIDSMSLKDSLLLFGDVGLEHDLVNWIIIKARKHFLRTNVINFIPSVHEVFSPHLVVFAHEWVTKFLQFFAAQFFVF